ncbi:MAG: hypothetical protein Q8M20_11935 [Rhodocyclaceae bacterium]|nr:hypothetical protein [Rhodocyclaceae bacterium]MDZ4214623.1 hypothetical protein [Rhodocyclaceae bacterium]
MALMVVPAISLAHGLSQPDSFSMQKMVPLPSGSDANLTATDRLATEAVDLLRAKRYDEASKKINEALGLRTDRSYYHLINGLVYHLQAREGSHSAYDLAEQGYQLAIQFDTSNWQAHYFSGLLAIDRSRFGRAVQHFGEAMMFRPDDAGLLHAMSYAAYRSGAPDIAAGAVKAMGAIATTLSPAMLRNSALIMAAVGEHEQANGHLEKLRATGNERLASHVQRRLGEWAQLYQRKGSDLSSGAKPVAATVREGLLPTQYAAPVPDQGQPQGQWQGQAQNQWQGQPPGQGQMPGQMPGQFAGIPGMPPMEDKMVVVDVVMIATEESFSTSKGVNLLKGLQINFGRKAERERINSSAGNWKNDLIDPTNNLDNSSLSQSLKNTITRTLEIPEVVYTLNIANSGNQRNEILARPTLVARTGRTSQFFSGTELSAVVKSGSTSTGPVNIEKQIGVQLAVTPNFMEDGRISLDVMAERNFLKPVGASGNFDLSIESSKSRVEASVLMRFGETLILGGLSEKEATNSRDGVPLLQDIPGIQYLFSKKTTSDLQKSVLILITPRPAQYVYQPENARKEYEQSLSEDERPLANLRARYADWFMPYPNWASVFHHMQENSLYREFRTGDVALENWSDMRTLEDRLNSVIDFIHY